MKEHPTMVPTYIGPRNSFTVSGVADMGLDIESEKGRRSTFYVGNLKRNRVLKCAASQLESPWMISVMIPFRF